MNIIEPIPKKIQASYIETEYKDTGNHKHFHNDYSIVYVLSGTHIFENDIKSFQVEKDEIRIINPNEFHRTLNTKWKYINFMLPVDYVELIASNIFIKNISSIKFDSVIKDEKATELFKSLDKVLKQKNSEYIEIEVYVIEFVEYLILNYSISLEKKLMVTPKNTSRLAKVKEYLDNHFSEKISLEEISNHVGYNKFHILREFKKEYNITPYQYLLIVRANKAKEMIQKNIPLSETAYSCGFSDQSNMIKNFKKIYNYTPSLVKNNIQEW